MTKSVLAVLALVVSQCVLSVSALGQVGSSCEIPIGVWSWEFPYPDVYGCLSVGVEGEDPCKMRNAACPPFAAPQEVCLACALAAAGFPIDLATGNTYIVETDIRIPGLGGGTNLVRTWNSAWPSTQSALQIGLFGPNWRSNFEERIFVGSDHYVKYGRGDGSFWSFGHNLNTGNWSLAAPANVSASLVLGSTYWTITFQNGEQRLFSVATGKLASIIDRNGNATQLTYDSLGRLATVTDPVSRHLTFSYGSGSSYLVTGVTSDAGPSLSYSYDTQGRLSVVTMPDLSTLTFQYNSQSLITSVTDSNGKILEAHTYDSSARGLTSTRANGVDAVTISYPAN
jgi:YD repeat-containing protein